MNNNLFRCGGYIAGVCEGLGIWSGIPSILWRIAFIFFIPVGFGFILFFGSLQKNPFKREINHHDKLTNDNIIYFKLG